MSIIYKMTIIFSIAMFFFNIAVSKTLAQSSKGHSQIKFGSYTHHYSPVGAQFFKHKARTQRDITNPLLGIRHYYEYTESSYASWEFFLSEDSIGSAIQGVGGSFGANSSLTELGVVYGAYRYNPAMWHKTPIRTNGIELDNNNGLVPILGVEINIKLGKYLRLNNVITPILSNHTIGICIGF